MSAREILASWYEGKAYLVFGHRGAMGYAPMNTIPTFELALEQGADAIELDVHLTKDGELVILHDFTIDHTTNSSGTVTDMTLAELKALDAGSWFAEEFAGLKIPTLGEVFEAVGDKLYINVEIKTQSLEGDGTEDAVEACIQAHGMSERVIISSFNPHVLKRYRAINPEMPIGFLLAPSTAELKDMLSPSEYDAIHYYYDMIGDDEIAFAHQHNHILNTWTVNDLAVAKKLVAKGVKGIMTDTPDVMVQGLA